MRRQTRRPRQRKKFYQINQRINAGSLRLIDNKGKLLGIKTKYEALTIARERDKDLVLIAPAAKPPVAKVVDFKKFLYLENKRQQKARKGNKKSQLKETKLSLFIAQGDLERRVKKTKDFLKESYQVRISLPLRGRQIIKKTMAFDLMKKFIGQLGEIGLVKAPRLEGKIIRAVVSKTK